eukprot:IDg22063t1
MLNCNMNSVGNSLFHRIIPMGSPEENNNVETALSTRIGRGRGAAVGDENSINGACIACFEALRAVIIRARRGFHAWRSNTTLTRQTDQK